MLCLAVEPVRKVCFGRLRRKPHGPSPRIPLAQVIARCEGKWVLENLQLGMQGDQQARERARGMLTAGFGAKQCIQDMQAWLKQVWAIEHYRVVEPCQNSSTSKVVAKQARRLVKVKARKGFGRCKVRRAQRHQGTDSLSRSSRSTLQRIAIE